MSKKPTNPHASAKADRAAIQIVLRNLIENAAYYGQRARIDLKTEDKGGCRIIMDDEGPGIPAANKRFMKYSGEVCRKREPTAMLSTSGSVTVALPTSGVCTSTTLRW